MRFFFCLVAAGLFLFPQSGTAQSNTERNILATEQRRFDAMVGRDSVLLPQLLADELIYVHSNALTENKTTHLQSIQTGRIVYQSMVREMVQLRRYAKMALTNGTVKVKGILNDQPFEAHLNYTAVYCKRQGTWQLLNWQSTRIP